MKAAAAGMTCGVCSKACQADDTAIVMRAMGVIVDRFGICRGCFEGPWNRGEIGRCGQRHASGRMITSVVASGGWINELLAELAAWEAANQTEPNG